MGVEGIGVFVDVAGGGGGAITVKVPGFVLSDTALPPASVAVELLKDKPTDPGEAPASTLKLMLAIAPLLIGV